MKDLTALISVDEPYEGEVNAEWLEEVAQAALSAAGVEGDAEVSLLITGDETVRELNAEYRGLDETTDVLSFSADHQGHWEGDGEGPDQPAIDEGFVLPPGIPQPLGEIVVSLPQAKRQAADHGVSPVSELAHLVVHGALHLVGYDHVEPEETAQMQALEREALESLSFDGLRMNDGTGANDGLRMNDGTGANDGLRMNDGTGANDGLRTNGSGPLA